MNDTKCVEILDCSADLVGEILDARFWQLEAPSLDVIEEVLSCHELKHDEVVLAILEDVLKLDDVRVLAHFKNFDLSSLLEDLDLLHVGLFHCLNCRLSSVSFVSSEFNHAKLTFSEHLTHVVEIEEVRVA